MKRALDAAFLAALFSFLWTDLAAQNVVKIVEILDSKPPEEEEEDSSAADEPADHSRVGAQPLFYLRDRSKVAGTPKLDTFRVRTRYGVLMIPRDELIRVRLVERLDPEIETKVTALIKRLGADDFDTREDAYEALLAVGPPALPLLREAMKSDNDEVKNRADNLVAEIQDEHEEETGNGKGEIPPLEGTDDEIVTTRMTIKGRVELENVTIVSRYGELVVDVADIQAISFQRIGPSVIELDIMPKYQPPGNWLDTKLSLEKGRRFRIEASGNISVSNYGVTAGPAGTRQWSGNSFKNFPMLSLVGKIGKKGKEFVVGTQYKSKAPQSGRLYLAIVPFSYNPTGAVGKFQAKIRVVGQP